MTMTAADTQPYESVETGTPIDESIAKAKAPDEQPPPKRVHRRTQAERLQQQYQSKQNVVDTCKARVQTREAELAAAQRELRVTEQELDLIGRMLELAKAEQELAQ
jgi:hypothetical protein